MGEPLRHLAEHARIPISVLPNAGLPSVVDGAMHYDLTPEGLAEHLSRFVTDYGVNAVGGCCGTTPAHLAAVVKSLAGSASLVRHPQPEPGAASIYSAVPFRQDTSFLVVGERTNANGSKRFREAMLEGDWDTCVAMAKDQVKEGSHVIDVCVDYTGADGVADMEADEPPGHPVERARDGGHHRGPRCRGGARWLGGRPILNSVNLEEGAEEGTRLDGFLSLAARVRRRRGGHLHRRGGPGAHRRVEGPSGAGDHRAGRRALRAEPEDVIIDPLALPLSTGMEESRRDGIETIEAIRRIKAELPGVSRCSGSRTSRSG